MSRSLDLLRNEILILIGKDILPDFNWKRNITCRKLNGCYNMINACHKTCLKLYFLFQIFSQSPPPFPLDFLLSRLIIKGVLYFSPQLSLDIPLPYFITWYTFPTLYTPEPYFPMIFLYLTGDTYWTRIFHLQAFAPPPSWWLMVIDISFIKGRRRVRWS